MAILIVEDQHEIRAIITDMLEDEGYVVASVTNGMEALTYLRQHVDQTDLILLDLGMPIMTGWEFREEQLRDPSLAKIPVIIVSATIDLQQKAAELEAADYLDKPVRLETLLSVIAQHYQ